MNSILYLVAGLLSIASYGQQTVESTYWRYINGMEERQVKAGVEQEVYDANGLLIEKSHNNGYNKTVYSYNEKKQKVGEEDFEGIDKPVIKRSYTYNENGQVATMSFPSRNKEGDNFTTTTTYSYDASGRLIKTSTTAEGFREGIIVIYTYENKGDKKIVTQRTSTASGKKLKYLNRTTTYNNKDLVVDEIVGSSAYHYEYIYDAQGEWVTKKVCLKQDRALSPWRWQGEYRRVKK